MAVVTIVVILKPKEIKSATVSTVSPSICYEVMGLDGEGNGPPGAKNPGVFA